MDKKGSILMISLWVMAILVIFAIGLGQRALINLKLARYQRDRLRAYCLAKAGINQAIKELENDNKNTYDAKTEPWADNEKAFSKIMLSDNENEFATVSYIDEKGETKFGVIDEERKININGLDKNQLQQLFILRGFTDDAGGLAETIAEWINSAKEPGEEKKNFKNEPLKTPEEILLILEYFYQNKGESNKAQEVFNNIRDLFTVYGDAVNINTISDDTLTILANLVAKNDAQIKCIAGLLTQIIGLKDAQGEKCFKNIDDIKIKVAENSTEEELFASLKNKLTVKSSNFKIESQGKVSNIAKKITAIYDRKEHKIISWHEN